MLLEKYGYEKETLLVYYQKTDYPDFNEELEDNPDCLGSFFHTIAYKKGERPKYLNEKKYPLSIRLYDYDYTNLIKKLFTTWIFREI